MKKQRFILYALLVGAAIAVIMLYQINITDIKLTQLYEKTQIISTWLLLVGTIVAVWQYLLSSNQNMNNKKRELEIREREIYENEKQRIEKAIDLAEYYKDNILSSGAIIHEVFNEVGILNILENIKLDKLKEFDIHELEENLSPIDIRRVNKLISSSEVLNALAKISMISKIEGTTRTENIEVIDGKESKSFTFDINGLTTCYNELISDTLNNLEYFSMHFVHKTADESVVYQSLHKSFLDLCRVLYYIIASRNINGEDKMFTNVIELFDMWKKRSKDQRKTEIDGKRNNILKGSTLG